MTSAPEPNPFDRASRGLVRRGGPALLAWLLDVPLLSLRFVRWLDTHLSIPGQPERVCDLVAHVLRDDHGSLPWANPIEFQVEPDGLMFGRLMVYEGMIWLQEKPTELPGDRFCLQSVVVNLTGVGKSGRTMQWKPGIGTSLEPVEWDLEKLDARVILEQIARGEAPRSLLAWVSLMKNGGEADIIRRWLELANAEVDSVRKADFALVIVFADLTERTAVWEKALEGFNVIESPTVNKWMAQAAAKATAKDLLAILEKKFSAIPAEVRAKIEATAAQDVLHNWVIAAATADTLDKFRQEAGV
jgi:hypothetical protein